MTEIKTLTPDHMREVVSLKAICWPEELAGLSDDRLDPGEACAFWTDWMQTVEFHNDVRRLYGAFEGGQMLGASFGSFVEDRDHPESGFELNGLWVHPQFRGRGVSLMLFSRLVEDFYALRAEKTIVYSFHHSPSNSYYRSLGFQVIDTELQMDEQLPVDIFSCGIGSLREALGAKLAKYTPR